MVSKIKIILLVLLPFIPGCGIYSFSGTSIPEDVETFSVAFFENNAAIVSPLLSQNFTEKLKSKFISETNLSIVEENGDFAFSGYITRYSVDPISVQGDDNAQLNRLTITVNVKMESPDHPELSFEQSFENFQDFDANTNFASRESQLNDEITDLLIQQIFNKAAINW
ncbi:hypothetical protein GYB22_10045 [bacterium]|nr:hypothetical protein [bacterium]